jgi:hypothetical protein
VGASQWWLARMYPDRWAKREKIDAKVDNSQKIEIVTVSTKSSNEEQEE